MKESYKRSKIALKPLNSSDFKSKSSLIDYDQYEQRLNNFENDKKYPQITDLFDWSKPSEVIALKQSQKRVDPQPQLIRNNSMNTEELLRSEEDNGQRQLQQQIELDDSIEIDSPIRSNISHQQTYMEKIKTDYGSQYRLMSVIKLEGELRDMRERIIEMNNALNKMLDKYELQAGKNTKKDPIITNPHKFFSKQIDLNNRIIQKQILHIKQLQQKDRELQKKDYLMELTQLIIEIKKEIHDLEKEKHNRAVGLQKIDKCLKQAESIQENGDQYKQVKELKHLIIFYFKKLKEQKNTQEQLEQDYQLLVKKEASMNQKLDGLAKIAQQKYLEVSTNKYYIDLKKDYQELVFIVESHRKKREILIKSNKGVQEKLEKQIQQLNKDIQNTDLDIQQVQYKSQEVDQETKQFMTKNKVLNRQLKSISYRFDESLIHPQKGKFKPDFRRRAVTKMEGKINKTLDINVKQQHFVTSNNDKNTVVPQSLESSQSNSSSMNSRMKPILRSWKGKPSNSRYIGSPEKLNTIDSSNIFKPSLLYKSRNR